jgi:hypothetical protein
MLILTIFPSMYIFPESALATLVMILASVLLPELFAPGSA